MFKIQKKNHNYLLINWIDVSSKNTCPLQSLMIRTVLSTKNLFEVFQEYVPVFMLICRHCK